MAQFGDSMTGSCFCCKMILEALDDWHVGHIIAHANRGKDTVDNLRPVCISCNLSMGTENMDAFKERCY
jgi:5-methylcytosine-specific restriction endonuclease McrA